jgi:hypothetical protein
MPDTPSRLPPGPPRAPGAAARECDQWLRNARWAELRRALVRTRAAQPINEPRRVIGYARSAPQEHA